MQHFDIAVIGGGLVGASFARAMAGSSLKILIIDRMPAHVLYSDALDNRGLALSHTTQLILTELNCWQLLAANTYPIETVHVSEYGSFGFTKLNAASLNLAALGYVVSANNLGKALIGGLEDLPDVTVLRPAEITQTLFDNTTNTWNITVNNQSIQVKLLVAADGANSELRASQNIQLHTTDYQQTAIVTNIGITTPRITCAYERFTQHGVIALLPFGAHNLKCVWTAPNAIAEHLVAQSDVEFLQALQAAFGFRLGKFNTVSERKNFAICQMYADQLYSRGMVLIGNAANTLHPVAAQGFNLGIRDATELAKILKQAQQNKLVINDPVVLQQYATLRQTDHRNTRSFTNSLVDIFAKENRLFKFYRRLGILAAQFIPPLNKKIIARGQGVWI